MTEIVAFTVCDLPRPQGSKRHVGHGVMVESGGQPLRNWREAVKQAALDNLPKGHTAYDGAVALTVTFYLPRPRSHYRTGANAHLLREAAPTFPARKPDIDKLLRSLLDSLTAAGVWTDDARVICVGAYKAFSDDAGVVPGARVDVEAA
jgi:Holliday junction resolvase RusA-like endonuclease